ncbi:hypothetical protein E5676_scaffold496G00620 [Cucumis melo var. makuwa]|uniref:Retrotransposon Copia-like N-terminal domain-containing protein n=2 Tax=Cucumis melo TaxID=3656 RepID=A0A5D3CPS4_CUCMM|nr:hypothetical protein E6C27_scaffold280G001330 [Cucumis melo var. makuwa]TYK13440.1 hypothetical protein E5676_scaffold496G00620 [Cucumis melo var. makuwa]
MAGPEILPKTNDPKHQLFLFFSANQTANPSAVEQYSNSYFLHHPDNTSIVLVLNFLTETTNYTSWSQAIKIGLTGKNNLGFINGGSIPKLSF